jgi:hypothetical protein
MFAFIRMLFASLFRRRPRGPQADPYAWKPVPRTRRPNDRAGAVAVAEPEDE